MTPVTPSLHKPHLYTAPRVTGTQPQPDWTSGPAKWAAVFVLGAVSIAGMGWSIFGREPRPSTGRDAASFFSAPAPTPSPAPAAPLPSKPLDDTPPLTPDTTAAAPAQRPAERSATPTVPSSKLPPAAGASRLINLNTATAAELELLPGIGPALAARIVEDRTKNGPYKRVDDIDRVKGIGPRLLEKIRPMAKVD